MSIFKQTIILFLFVSCTSNVINEDKIKKDNIKFNKENLSILKSKEVLDDPSFIVNRYPISSQVEILQEQTKTPRPKELFSASSQNEIRLHKLGEVRWVYLGLEPSSVWPMAIEFFKNNEIYKLGAYDPSKGIINSKNFIFNNQETKIEFKIERGLQQSSSEIFVSHLINLKGNWEIIPNEKSNLNKIVNELYDFLSTSAPSSGTSLVALNLNTSNKTEVITNQNGSKFIKLRVNYARAWAATRRSLQLAGYKILDEDRNTGKFYLEYIFKRSILSRTPSLSEVVVSVKEVSSDECIISTNLNEDNLDISQDIISQINQALS
ncbi:outer membrane protein assembly factor BamC [Gammaproteobacteria bacterium]|nr:outer membrane protein assembly factor BamC [Gammaproteobacteria bacterium]